MVMLSELTCEHEPKANKNSCFEARKPDYPFPLS